MLALTLGIAGIVVVVLTAVLTLSQAKPRERTRQFVILTIALALIQILVTAGQWVNTELVEAHEKKRLERETALALWAFRDRQEHYLTALAKDHPYLLGYYYFKQGDYSRATAALNDAIKKDQYTAAAHYVKAVILRLQNGDLTDARNEIEAALAYDPDYSVLYVERGLQELRGQEIAKGLASFKHAIESSTVHCASLATIDQLGPTVVSLVRGEPTYQGLLTSCSGFMPSGLVAQAPGTPDGVKP